ncbi:MOP flippase family protein [Desulfogranum marinum]|uniref:MOP flippase family protein n=1 Tax=Desulfogranum marinum TaxID=453220 RepID=UPI001962579A|nr:MOP flippase family protein [Desulfogranum marinum]MBM9513277.1 MOP flippase family protein [Desulfogranum marinum]
MESDKKQNHFFDTKDQATNLKKRSLRSGAVTLTSQGLIFLINIGSTMVLARLLTPRDYGMITMVAAITGFARIFSDLGLSSATIQRADINHMQISNLFWINAGTGAVITMIVAAVSPAVAWFYKTPQLLSITAVLSLNFLIIGLAIQHRALLTRQMQFFTMAKIQIFSTLLGITVAVFMAMHGYRYWALVLNTLSVSACNVICFWFVCKWRPGLPQRKSGVRPMLRFGSDIAGFNIINYFSRNLDNILIGRYYGTLALGHYSKAYQLLMLPIANLREPLNKVALPSLSRLQSEPEKYRSYYIKFISLLAFMSMPLVAFMFACSENIIRLVLGSQWIGANELFKILAFAAFIQPVLSTRGVVLLSTGQSRKYLWWGTGNAIVTTISFILGLPWGAKGVATAYATANYLLLYPSLFYVFKNSHLRVNDFFAAIYKPFTASLAMGIVCFLLQNSMKAGDDIFVLAICFVASLVVYLLAMVAVSGGTKDLREYYSYGRLAFTRK